MVEYYVYEYWNPLTDEPFYVGKGAGNRYLQHLSDARHDTPARTNIHKCNTIKKIWDNDLEPEIKFVLRTEDENEALELEKKLIEQYGRKYNGTGCLTNFKSGGKQPPSRKGTKLTEEQKDKLKGKTPWNKGKKMSDEFKKKIIDSCTTRKPHSTESHKRQGAAMKKYHATKE